MQQIVCSSFMIYSFYPPEVYIDFCTKFLLSEQSGDFWVLVKWLWGPRIHLGKSTYVYLGGWSSTRALGWMLIYLFVVWKISTLISTFIPM